MTPRFEHDCDCCHFLGHLDTGERPADLYAHTAGTIPTVIARFSADGPDYSSGLCFSYGAIPELTEARRRAQAQGLMPYDVMAALTHLDPEDSGSVSELHSALPFTEEYQAVLAFEAGHTERHIGLVTHLVQLQLAQSQRRARPLTPEEALDSVGSRVSKVVQARRNLRALIAWQLAEAVCSPLRACE